MASFKETPPIPRQIHPHLLDLLTDSRNRRNGGRVFKSHSTGRTRGNTLLTDKIKAIKIRARRETLYSTPSSPPPPPSFHPLAVFFPKPWRRILLYKVLRLTCRRRAASCLFQLDSSRARRIARRSFSERDISAGSPRDSWRTGGRCLTCRMPPWQRMTALLKAFSSLRTMPGQW